jgi:hypothetical protein
LHYLTQEVFVLPEAETSSSTIQRINITAEFYRIAAGLYLEQVARSSRLEDTESVQNLAQEGYVLLNNMEVCTSPWPLFILACHSNSDEQRTLILNTLQTMQKKRRIGNVTILEAIIQAIWRQEDLFGAKTDAIAHPFDWRDLIDESCSMPLFV